MANSPSARKRARQNTKRRDRNRAHMSALRSAIKRVRSAAENGDSETAKSLLPGTLAMIDSTRSRGVIHRNSAARRKSRLTRLVNTLDA
ncbi:MAG: 30S ribosomal protein S20 [Acidobacteriota bacterium]